MVLLSPPANPGTAKDAYEALDIAFGGSDFDDTEGASVVANALGISEGKAQSLVSSLVQSGCAM